MTPAHAWDWPLSEACRDRRSGIEAKPIIYTIYPTWFILFKCVPHFVVVVALFHFNLNLQKNLIFFQKYFFSH
jgi:hypothetical protein